MLIIKELSDKIQDELHDANKYINAAYEHMDDQPQVADAYFKLSQEEMSHVNFLHEQVIRIINEYKATHDAIPAGMQAFYDMLHEQQIKKANKIKQKQEQYRK